MLICAVPPSFNLARNIPESVEAPGELAVGSEGDDASVAVDGGELFLDDFIGGRLQPHAFVLHEGADGAGDGESG